jgi:hypothetical protein
MRDNQPHMLDSYLELKAEGYSIAAAAERLGLKQKALEHRIVRARQAGDERFAVQPTKAETAEENRTLFLPSRVLTPEMTAECLRIRADDLDVLRDYTTAEKMRNTAARIDQKAGVKA